MPTYPSHACGAPGCPNLVGRGKARCPTHETTHARTTEALRGSAHERGYDARWRAARLRYLAEHPLCVKCTEEGRVTPGRVVDHIVDHLGDPVLFWDESNWQTLCDFTSPFNCHGTKTALTASQRGR